MSTNEMQSRINELRELRRMAEELDAEIAAIQDEIKANMTRKGVDEISGIDYRVTWKTVTSTRLDTAGLKKAAPELCSRFMIETISRRFIVA